ncbi:MAG: DNA-binding protein [Opitutaceae bacterium]|nr:DNA-binding protein [Opitutaceae bacterium]
MAAGLSKAKKVRSLKEAREAFHRSGKSVKAWAQENGFSVALCYEVLAGGRKCLRGQSHQIAVKLGIKDGVIADDKLVGMEKES